MCLGQLSFLIILVVLRRYLHIQVPADPVAAARDVAPYGGNLRVDLRFCDDRVVATMEMNERPVAWNVAGCAGLSECPWEFVRCLVSPPASSLSVRWF